MAAPNRPTQQGAVGTRPSQTPEYSSRGVFNDSSPDVTGQIQSSTVTNPAGAIGETQLGPSTPVSGGGGNANNSAVNLLAGAGIDGGGSFTLNQASDATISFDLPMTFTPAAGQMAGTAIGTADNPIQSITIDQFGRVESVTVQTSTPLPEPFRDDFTAQGDTRPLAAPTSEVTEDITLEVDPGYTIGTPMVMSTGTIPVSIGTPTGVGTNMVTIPVTIPAFMDTDSPGPASVETTTTVTETSSGRTMEETSTPFNRNIFIPFYQGIFTTRRQNTIAIADLAASTSELTNGTMIQFNKINPGRDREYAYLALEMVSGRNYRFDAGFFDISADALSHTGTMFGRTFNFYEFPTRGDLSFTIRF